MNTFVTPKGNLITEPSDTPAVVCVGIPSTPQAWHAHIPTCQRCRERGVPRDGWRCGSTVPETPGTYHRLFTDGVYLNYWDGAAWHYGTGPKGRHHRQPGEYPAWRRIALPLRS